VTTTLDVGRWDAALLMFMTLFALYSPLAALPSYMPIVGRYEPRDQRKLALGLLVNVAVFVLAGLWVGEVLLEVLGISTAALTTAGGIALLYESIPLMRGEHETHHTATATATATATDVDAGEIAGTASNAPSRPWRSILLTPVTFPLTVGGATFGVLVAFAASAQDVGDRGALTVAGLAYATVTAITLYLSTHVHRRISQRGRDMLDRIAGILLTSIGVMLLASGATRLVVDVLDAIDA
jgi:multiple antibiotic resistance protein